MGLSVSRLGTAADNSKAICDFPAGGGYVEDDRIVENFGNGSSIQEERFEEKLPFGQGYVEKEVYQQDNGHGK